MKRLFIVLCVLFFSGCETTKYVERQSEELSRAVYATKDSLNNSRLDLADKYSDETTRLVTPPKQRIPIKPIVKKSVAGVPPERVVILPEKYKKDKVVFVDSTEYQDLLKDLAVADQLKLDFNILSDYSKQVDSKLAEQLKINNEMIVKIQVLEKKILEQDAVIAKKNLALLGRNLTILGLIALFGACIWLRIKGIL